MIVIEDWAHADHGVRKQLPTLLLAYHRRTELEKHLGGEPTPGGSPLSLDIGERYRTEVEDLELAFADDSVLLAVEGSTALGCVVLTSGPSPEIKRLWVDPAARRRGVASMLLDSAAGIAAARGAHEVRLSVWSWRTSAIGLYERHGFAPAPSWDGRPKLSCFVRPLS